jgi:integrase
MARINFTAARLAAFECPPGKQQAFLWSNVSGLALRATAGGAKAYIFQSRLDGRDLRVTIGGLETWTIAAAEREARRLQALIDQGKDPRIEKAAGIAAEKQLHAANKIERQRRDVTGLDAWSVYCQEGKKHGFRQGPWSELHARDHESVASSGGQPLKRGKGVTQPGLLHGLLSQPLAAIDAARLEAWVKKEAAVRPTRTRLAFRLLRAFLNWCAEHPEYQHIAHADAPKARKARERLGKPKAKDDALQREQLPAWFEAVRNERNTVISAYLQCLLLTGARPEELMSLQWADVDFAWKVLTIRDKVSGQRTIPLTPYVAQLLSALPRLNGWVFSSPTAQSGRLQDPRANHERAVAAAALPHLTLHGLRRSFGTLSEWVECPVGIAAQIQGHKPSAIAEKHYRVRPIDLLRVWHEKIEAWVLDNAKVPSPARQTVPTSKSLAAA